MNGTITLRNLTVAGITCLLAAACSDTDDGSRLPDGQYPMTFTATVDGLTATRATGKDAWTKDDQIAVSVDGGASSKNYKITNASSGAMEPAVTGDGYYWQNSQEKKTILAWYPAVDIANVDISDQSAGFAAFDYLKTEATTASFGSDVALSFRHQMAKVKCVLTNGADISADEISQATVYIYGYTHATFEKGVVSSTDNANGWIDSDENHEAVVIPQNMSDENPFIKVTINNHDYIYTPKSGDANLTAGNQYTYTLTLKRTGLDVQVSDVTPWTEETVNSTPLDTDFQMRLADFSTPEHTNDYKVTDANNNPLQAGNIYTISPGDEISISLSADNGYRLKKFHTAKSSGIYKIAVSYTADTRTYSYRFYDIRSDLRLQVEAEAEEESISLPDPQIGDYYYVDGTYSSTLDKPCIGIVFKVGAAGNEQTGNYSDISFANNVIHGYAVALNDANSGNTCDWGKRGVETPIANVDNKDVTAYTGYSDTKTIISNYQNTETWNDYAAFKSVVVYRSAVPAPVNSSGWYLPSLAQLGDVYTALASIGTNLASAGNAFRTDNDGRYWTSSEKNKKGQDSWYVKMNNGTKESYAKDGSNYSRACYVRAILTF